jgi:hypothetical protein
MNYKDIPKPRRVIEARWMLFSLEELERIHNGISDASVTSPPLARLYEELDDVIGERQQRVKNRTF